MCRVCRCRLESNGPSEVRVVQERAYCCVSARRSVLTVNSIMLMSRGEPVAYQERGVYFHNSIKLLHSPGEGELLCCCGPRFATRVSFFAFLRRPCRAAQLSHTTMTMHHLSSSSRLDTSSSKYGAMLYRRWCGGNHTEKML